MTTYRKSAPAPPPPRPDHLALWTGLTALFTNLAAINLLALLGDESNPALQLVVALVTAIAAAAAVYTRQRMADEKARRRKRTPT